MNNSTTDIKNRAYRAPIRPQYRRKNRRNNNFPKALLLLAIIVVGVCLYLNFKLNFGLNDDNKSMDLTFNFSPRRQNILLMGVDVATNTKNPFKGNRTDTMLLISIAPMGKDVNVISIPRDSKVYIQGKDKPDKINHAFAFGGAKLAVKTVEDSFGVKINNYIAISNQGVIQMIDTLGGLPIYIEKPMKYNDFTAGLHINLQEGNHVLSGKQTEGYLRFRHDSYGDIGRIRRQQWFFNALLARLKDPSVITKIPELLKIIPQYIQTDMSGYELAKLAGVAKNIDSSTIQIATLPGAPSTKTATSYWILDPEKTQELINNMVYRNKANIEYSTLTAGIMYDAAKAQDAQVLKEELEQKGLTVKMEAASGLKKDVIAIHNIDISGEIISDLKKDIDGLKSRHTVYDPIAMNRNGKDFTVVISN